MSQDILGNTPEFEEEAKRILLERENGVIHTYEEKHITGNQSTTSNYTVNAAPFDKSLGKIQVGHDRSTVVEEIGWIRLKPETLPSQGIFYPQGTEITIRAASAGEIRHWSTLDEDDLLSLDDALNRVAEKCCRIKFPTMMGSFKDIKEIDRFFIVFAIREFTFKRGENNLTTTFKCVKCDHQERNVILLCSS